MYIMTYVYYNKLTCTLFLYVKIYARARREGRRVYVKNVHANLYNLHVECCLYAFYLIDSRMSLPENYILSSVIQYCRKFVSRPLNNSQKAEYSKNISSSALMITGCCTASVSREETEFLWRMFVPQTTQIQYYFLVTLDREYGSLQEHVYNLHNTLKTKREH